MPSRPVDHDAVVVAGAARPTPCPSARRASTSSYGPLQRVAPAAAAGGPDADHLAGAHRLGVGQGVDLALVRSARVDGHLERPPGLAAATPQQARIDRSAMDMKCASSQHPDVLLVAEAAAVPPGAAGVDGQAEPLDQEREPRLGELGRQVARVGHHVDGVLAVGVVAAAGAAAEHLAHEVRRAVGVLAVHAGVADRLLVGGHPAVDGLGEHAGEHAEQPQDHERAGVGRAPGRPASAACPVGGNRISISGTTPSLTSSSAIRSGVSARLRRIGASHFFRKLPSA